MRNTVKFLIAGPFLELVDPRIPGDPYGLLVDNLPPTPRKVLDLCGGTGYAGRSIARRLGADVIVLDASSQLLGWGQRCATAAGLQDSMRFVRGDASSLPFDAEAFDAAVCAFGLHELRTETRRVAVMELARVLRPGGTLGVVDLDWPARWRRGFLAYVRASHHPDAQGVLGHGLREQVALAGFEVISASSGLGGILPFQHLAATRALPD